MASVLRSAVATRPAAAGMRLAAPSCPRLAALVPTRLPVSTRPSARRIVARAADQADDFDAVLMKYAEKWEKAENKPVVIGYLAAAFAALFTAEWLIHLPALDFLLGGPIQLVGLFTLPYLIVRWGIDGVKPGDDVDQYSAAIISKLPGLKKE